MKVTPVGMSPTGQFVIAVNGDTLAILANVANTGDYNDLTNKPSVNTTRTTSNLTIGLVGSGATGTQISASKDSKVMVTFSTSVTITLGGSPVSRIVGKVCPTNSVTENDWIESGRTSTSQPTTLTVTVGGVYTQEGQITVDVPAGYFVKFVNSGAGTHSEAFVSGRQTIFG